MFHDVALDLLVPVLVRCFLFALIAFPVLSLLGFEQLANIVGGTGLFAEFCSLIATVYWMAATAEASE